MFVGSCCFSCGNCIHDGAAYLVLQYQDSCYGYCGFYCYASFGNTGDVGIMDVSFTSLLAEVGCSNDGSTGDAHHMFHDLVVCFVDVARC